MDEVAAELAVERAGRPRHVKLSRVGLRHHTDVQQRHVGTADSGHPDRELKGLKRRLGEVNRAEDVLERYGVLRWVITFEWAPARVESMTGRFSGQGGLTRGGRHQPKRDHRGGAQQRAHQHGQGDNNLAEWRQGQLCGSDGDSRLNTIRGGWLWLNMRWMHEADPLYGPPLQDSFTEPHALIPSFFPSHPSLGIRWSSSGAPA